MRPNQHAMASEVVWQIKTQTQVLLNCLVVSYRLGFVS